MSCGDLGRYGYSNALWSLRHKLTKNETSNIFMRGIETSFLRYPLPEIEESQFFVSLSKETQELLEQAELRLKTESINVQEEGRKHKKDDGECEINNRKSQTTNSNCRVEHGEREEEAVKSESSIALVVATEQLRLTSDGRTWWDWSIGHIRRYGHDKSCFYFEAGRRTKTGEGMFVLGTGQGKEIYEQVAEMKSLCQLDALCQRGVPIHTLDRLPEQPSPAHSHPQPQSPSRVVRGASLRVKSSEESKSRGMHRRSSAPDNLVERATQARHHTPLTPQPRRPHHHV